MDWIGLALGLIKLVNLIMGFVDREKAKQDGRNELLAEQAVLLMRKVEKSKAVMEWARGLTESEVDAELRKLEPGGDG